MELVLQSGDCHLCCNIVRHADEEDVQVFAEAIPNASSAAIVLFEHTWARGLAEALDRSGGAISSEAILHGGRVFPTAL